MKIKLTIAALLISVGLARAESYYVRPQEDQADVTVRIIDGDRFKGVRDEIAADKALERQKELLRYQAALAAERADYEARIAAYENLVKNLLEENANLAKQLVLARKALAAK